MERVRAMRVAQARPEDWTAAVREWRRGAAIVRAARSVRANRGARGRRRSGGAVRGTSAPDGARTRGSLWAMLALCVAFLLF